MKGSKRHFASPNKPLIPLVQPDYANESVTIFKIDKDNSSKYNRGFENRTTDYYDGREPRKEQGRVFDKANGDRTREAPERSRRGAEAEDDRFYFESYVGSKLDESRIGNERRDWARAEVRERHGSKRKVNDSMRREMYRGGDGEDGEEEGDEEVYSDDRGAGGDRNDREIDISTYIKEQRMLIKRVSSGNRLPTMTKLMPSVHYELKELKREIRLPGGRNLKSKSRQIKFRSNDVSLADVRLNLFNSSKISLKPKEALRNKLNLINMKEGRNEYGTQEYSDINYRSDRRLGEPIGRVEREINRRRDRFERVDSSLIVDQQDYRRDTLPVEEISKEMTKESFRKVRTATEEPGDFYIGRGSDQLFPAKKTNRLETNTKQSKPNNTQVSGSPRDQKNVIIVGNAGSEATLASFFKKKASKRNVETLSRPEEKPPLQKGRKSSLELSKHDLVKRRMEYGKKKDRSKSRVTVLDRTVNSEQSSIVGFGKNSSQTNLLKSSDRRNSTPKKEVLDRLAKGIRPKVKKSEIHEITKRQLEKFKKLNTANESATKTRTNKKADLLERKSKVKELDMVNTY